MDKNKKKLGKNPREGAKLLSVITFKWLFGTFLMGYKHELEITDLYSPLDEHSSRLLGNKMSHLWNQELEKCKKLKKTPSLLRVLVRYFGCDIMIFGLSLAFLELVVKIMQPTMLANLLQYFRGNRAMKRTEAFYWSTAIVLGDFLDCFIFGMILQGLEHIGMKMRVACCSLIYRKVLKVPKYVSDGKTNVGQMINLLSNDVNRFDSCPLFLHYIWIAPIQAVLISYLLYRQMGLAALGGIAILLLSIYILAGYYGKLVAHLTAKIAYRTDERLKLTNQIINGIKVIKMFAWEKPFIYLNNKAREKELKVIKHNSIITELSSSLIYYIPQICIFVTVLFYVLLGKNIDAEKVYLVKAYYSILRMTNRLFLISLKYNAEALVSVKRLTKFLLYDEIKLKPFTSINSNNVNLKTNDDISLSFCNVTAKWSSESKSETLKKISFQLQSGSLTAVIGQVGAGKTTLFQAILQEIPYIRGEIKINGNISYASQEPWLFASSIKQNILFGKVMDKARYEKVIEVCQLKRDFQLLPYGENTLVGEKGSNLSGGQRARINLARAVYHEADIYLLDDPLSAVDTHVGKSIFNNCIKHFLKKKTVILITHQFQYLKFVDRVIALGNSTVLVDGTYDNLYKSGLNLTKTVQESKSNEISDNDEQTLTEKDEGITMSNIEEEQSESKTADSNTSNTYLRYFKAARNGGLVFIAILICLICQISKSAADYFVAHWVNVEEKGGMLISGDNLLRGRGWYICIYGSIILLSIAVVFAQVYIFYHMCTTISKNLHGMMFTNVTKTKMSFFNGNPIGRIMNRFSKDLEIIDTRTPRTIHDVIRISLYTFAIVSIVASVNRWIIIAILDIAMIIYLLRSFYIKTSRTIKRLEGITRSPVFNHLSDSVHGLTTIRALNAQQILINEFDDYQDVHSSTWFIYISGSTAFGMYIDLFCTIFTGIVIYTLVFDTDIVAAGDAGLVISQCMLMKKMVQWGVRQTTELESQMTSVERILEYSNLEQEPLFDRKSADKVHEKWPQQGQIVFEDVTLIYDRQQKSALKNLNFVIESKEIIGIVGRTGAGKSSIINALFRLFDIQGEIYIDNVATSKIALQDLRSKISIIPQEPMLFAGSLRKNLDPFDEYSDDALLQALEDVEFKAFRQSDLDLYMEVAEGGTNFSVGQRQLLCLARAIVKNNNILVLDEATANVDPLTDEIIQKAVRKKFVNCTVIIIAHRLNTIMDSNKILVMDAGRIVEFDHSYNLLRRRNGVFYNMVQQTGASMAANLFQVAKLNYENSHKD